MTQAQPPRSEGMLDRVLDVVDRVLGGPPPKPGAVTRHRVRIVWPARVVAGIGALATVALLVLPGTPNGVAQAATEASAFSRTATIVRSHLEPDGSDSTVDTRTVTVNVDQTQNLRGRQQIRVSWSGAHPTGGVVADPNSAAASRQEYPVVIFECRGLDTAGAPADQRLDPTTCWTQTPDERYQATFNGGDPAWPAWRVDRYAPPSERHAIVDAPNPNPCPGRPDAARYVPFVAAPTGTGADAVIKTYYGGANGCAGIPPDAVTVQEPAAPPTNTTYATTRVDGTGEATFVVSTDQQNASLGCSDQVPCELVIIPIMGIGCDATASSLVAEDRPPADQTATVDAACRSTGRYDPGELFSSAFNKGDGDPAVSGALWWSASNWRNRVTVPITFAPPPNACDILDTRTPTDIYGSELMNQVTVQWAAAFCHDPRKFKFRHVRTGEPQAKAALAAGSIDAAFVSRPPSTGYVGPTVSAPVAVTGFAITFVMDDTNKHEVTSLKLNPRLLAKLLSESYWAFPSLKADYAKLSDSDPYKAMLTNPQDMALDPEFQALNPGITSTTQSQSAATLLALSGNSDVMYALTSYINADPEARAFLNGRPDPWGMVVNPSYKGIVLPAEVWPLLDSFLSPDITLDGCLLNDKGELAPVPILPLVAAPVSSMTTIGLAMQYALANSSTICIPRLNQSQQQVGGTLRARGRQQPGSRFMLGVTSLGDAEFFGLNTAALQSNATVADLNARFTDDTGRHFVVPSDNGMLNAIKLSTFDKTTGTWPIPYAKLRTAAGQNAYPGTMVVYAAIPTRGLAATDATKFAQLLTFAASDGQQPGITDGQLPPGFVPMTPANGLGALTNYTLRAATAVAAQTGAVPPLTTIPGTGGSTGGNGGGGNSGGNSGGTHTQRPSPQPELSPWTPGVEQALGSTPALRSQVARWTMPSALLVAVLAGALALVIQAAATMRAAGNLRARLSQLIDARRRP